MKKSDASGYLASISLILFVSLAVAAWPGHVAQASYITGLTTAQCQATGTIRFCSVSTSCSGSATQIPSDGSCPYCCSEISGSTTTASGTGSSTSSQTAADDAYRAGSEYGQACSGNAYNTNGQIIPASGNCIARSYCRDARLIAPVTSGTNCTSPGACCASQDLTTTSGTSTSTGSNSNGTGSASTANGTGSAASGSASTTNGTGSTSGGSLASSSSASTGGGWTAGQQRMLGLGLPNQSIGTIVTTIVYALLVLLAAGSTIAFIWAGFKYLLASGDEKEAGVAKNMLKYSITGIVVALAGVVVIQAVTMILNGYNYF